MGMSMHVVGYRAPDEEWRKKVEAYRACLDAGVKVPDELDAFFQYEDPTGKPGIEVPIKAAVSKLAENDLTGYEVDLTKLPAGLKVLRFYASW